VGFVGFLVGASAPQVAPLSRTRLATIVTRNSAGSLRRRALSLVMSYESVADESAFVVGPVVIGVVATTFGAGTPLAVAAFISAIFVVGFALHPTATRISLVTHHQTPAAAGRGVFVPRVLVLPLGMFLVGAFFGSILTALTVFMRDRGLESATGIIYGGMSIGAVVTAVAIIFAPTRFTLRFRWVCFGAIVLLSAASLVATSSVVLVTVGLATAGCGIGVVIVTLFSTANKRTPAGRTTTVMTMLSSALIVGQALFTGLGGYVAERAGSSFGFGLATLAVVLLVLTGVVSFAIDEPAAVPHSEAKHADTGCGALPAVAAASPAA
jgi:hypothetical protein